ncbi:Lrp/AsnC family transcriptional regulator [Rhodobacter sp. Har01]|uniref:Lrp/AsnC family transcriptional regulator n=1 Tax=Rhodobacter sp. Har01 TaxID=2883999 RepID=UPI001D08AC9F|nr:Lrp/AsnC family transcriptional regulator [Rhodobacter sp. Har01]MCB6177503.1 Lrp/AsnC family transcriptional regulator [Rhodobacter sp. Har01]
MDEIDRRIIGLLAEDARRALADIGAAVGLSASAVNDRIHRLQAQGAIRRFTVDADPAALGLPVLAFAWIALRDGADEPAFRAFAAAHPAVIECHHVTGPWSYLLKLRLPALSAVETVLADLKAQGSLGRSETILALSSAVEGAHVPRGAA